MLIQDDVSDPVTRTQYAFKIINSMSEQEYEGKLNAVLVLNDIFDTKNYSEIFKSENINRQLFRMLSSSDDLTVRCTLTFLNTLYRKFPFYIPKSNTEEQDNFVKLYLPKVLNNGENLTIMPHIDQILKEELGIITRIIGQDTSVKIAQQYGGMISTFGATRLEASKFIVSIISQGNTEYAMNLAPCLQMLLDHCMQYQWNSLLHNNVEAIFNELFKKDSKYTDDIRTAVIAETNLADFIANIEMNISMPDSGRPIRSGIAATFYSIANMLKDHQSDYVHDELLKSEKWLDFVSTNLRESNDNNDQALAGHQSKGYDSDDDASNYETSMDKLFAQFTSLKENHDSSRELDDDEDEEEDAQGTQNVLAELNDTEDFIKKLKELKDGKRPAPDKTLTAPVVSDQTKQTADREDNEKAQAQKIAEESKKDKDSDDDKDVDESKSLPIVESDSTSENSGFYDNSYWGVSMGFKLDDLLQDC